jgi:hypothetical protein
VRYFTPPGGSGRRSRSAAFLQDEARRVRQRAQGRQADCVGIGAQHLAHEQLVAEVTDLLVRYLVK